ncbi:hypothetical protein HNQ59_001557 [Chitinivorax tropicus]|uniref:Uncharacterized protein n=1 Tax=Chitinivorax tropicus TaxID=714531 RepID=A0A840MMB5_9PROT|nr:hypothetical protein [Chitinivorax tropicus]MBB5018269.1 hypothetical protein [Chitinivorax tropicus]
MNYIQAFCDNPKAFMESHIVMVGIAENEMSTLFDISVIDLTTEEGYKVMNKPGGRVFGLYKVNNVATSTSPRISAYWCPFTKNRLKDVTLGNEAKYVFTQPMNGCTFGIGTYAGNGVQRVAHVNCANAGNAVGDLGIDMARQQQQKLQRNLLISDLGRDVQLIEPTSYRIAFDSPNQSFEATTFGQHTLSQPWTFFTHRYCKIGAKTFIHGGVHPA